jgi:hypothetical protein
MSKELVFTYNTESAAQPLWENIVTVVLILSGFYHGVEIFQPGGGHQQCPPPGCVGRKVPHSILAPAANLSL